jgi:hypothetical protein
MSYNPMMDRWKNGKKTGPAYKRARKQEKETSERLGGKKIAASGSRVRKADVEVPDIARIECKATRADSFRVTKEMLQKVEDAALPDGQMPMIEIEFVDDLQKTLYACCVIKRSDLTNLIRRLADAEGKGPTSDSGKRLLKQHRNKLAPNKR